MLKYTPGPWQVFDGQYPIGTISINKDATIRICTIKVNEPGNAKEAYVNANLIAATPDLFKAVINACGIIATHVNMKEWEGYKDKEMYIGMWNQIESALAKARGEKENV